MWVEEQGRGMGGRAGEYEMRNVYEGRCEGEEVISGGWVKR